MRIRQIGAKLFNADKRDGERKYRQTDWRDILSLFTLSRKRLK